MQLEHSLSYRTPQELVDFCRSSAFQARFFAKVNKTNSCWLWAASVNQGRGQIGVSFPGKRMLIASVASWLIHKGAIPSGYCVCHNCPDGDNPLCVNPDHLWLGTQLENVADMVRKNRSARGESHSHSKLKQFQVDRIRELCECGSHTQEAIAKMFGITQGTVSGIKNRVHWVTNPSQIR